MAQRETTRRATAGGARQRRAGSSNGEISTNEEVNVTSKGQLPENGNRKGHDDDTLPGNNIETQLEHQIHSQLQEQVRDSENDIDPSLKQQDHVGDSKANNSHSNTLDATNIDDELKNLESIDISSINKSDVDDAAAAVASYARAAAAGVGLDLGVVDHDESDNVHVEVDPDVMADIVKHATIGHLKANRGEDNVNESDQDYVHNQDENDDDEDNDVLDVNLHGTSITRGKKRKFPSTLKEDDIANIFKGTKFYLPFSSSENDNLSNIVESCGGEIVTSYNEDAVVLIPSRDEISEKFEDQYTYRYVYDTYTKRSIQSLKKYKVMGKQKPGQELEINIGDFPPHKDITNDTDSPFDGGHVGSSTAGAEANPVETPRRISVPKRRSKKFTPEEDGYILDLVRRNPHLRSTHTFFARISELKPLSEHTGNSIRYRYRKILASQLEYVYKLDPETGKPELDPNTGQPIQIREIPSLIKSQYTPEEDYQLCKHIWAFKSGRLAVSSSRKSEMAQIPEAVFDELYKKNSRHSSMSWRDRYRKFAAKYGLKNYMEYYENCLENNIAPEPMKNMSSRANRKDYKVDVFENEKVKSDHDTNNILSKRMKLTSQAVDIPNRNNNNMDVDGGERENDGTNVGVVDNANETAVDPVLAATQAVAGSAMKALEEVSDPEEGNGDIQKTIQDKEAGNKDIETEKEDEPIDEDTNLFVSATDAEMKQYDISLSDSTKQDVSDESAIKNTDNADNSKVTHPDNTDPNVELVNIKADDGLMDFRQLIEIDPEPLKNRADIDLDSMVQNIHTCFRNFGDNSTPYELFKDISDQTGISMLWLNYWFDCSCGMLGTFIQAIIHYLETGELILNKVSGFWTEKDDELLRLDPDNEELLKLHGKVSVTKRKAVLFSFV